MDNLLSILVLNYYSTYIMANTDMHYTITNINMNTPTNTNNHLHIGINMYISNNTTTYLHIFVYISIHTVIIHKTMNTLKHPCANIFVLFIPIYQCTNISLYYRMNDSECTHTPIYQ